jgi:ankyrin repeat protein
MQIAARNGCIAMLQALYEHHGDLSTRGPKGETLFHLAAYNGHVSTMIWLHSQGILPEAVDIYGQTAAHIAARRGEVLVLQYLHEHLGMDVLYAEDFDGRTPIECIPRRGPEELQACRDYLDSLLPAANAMIQQQPLSTSNLVCLEEGRVLS